MNRPPFVYLYSDAQEALQILARGKNGVVWVTLGILLPTHPEGITLGEVVTITGLTKDTVQAALTSLTVSGLIEDIGGNFAPSKYMEYRKAGKKSFSDAEELASSSTSVQPKNLINFYYIYSEIFGELAQLRSMQAEEQIERIESFPAEWVTESFRRTREREMADVESGNDVWWQTRRISYALRILGDWKQRGEMEPRREPKRSNGGAVLEIML